MEKSVVILVDTSSSMLAYRFDLVTDIWKRITDADNVGIYGFCHLSGTNYHSPVLTLGASSPSQQDDAGLS